MWRCFLVVLCAVCAQSRLRTDVIPELYHLNLNLTSGLDNPTNSYSGSVNISLNVTNNVRNFTFHALGLTILDTSLVYEVHVGDQFVQLYTGHNRTFGNESVTISSDNIPAGRHTLNIVFEGKFDPELEGFYKSSYIVNQTKRWMASTHFEAQGARKAFPCFDEPNMRAKLILELTLPTELHAVSNMPISTSSTLENGWKLIQFAESPAMPTYLMAWYVSDNTFDALFNPMTRNGITYNVHGRVNFAEQAEYAQNITPIVITGLESFTGVTYASSGMSTIGQAAIPDFSAGAMENWGLVTYRESYLLFDQVASSVLDKQHTLLVIAHELTHQWFGNAVTLDWWSYTWLNEGFARYLQYVIPSEIERGWMLEDQFLTDVFQLSMAADLDSHPLTNPNVTSKDEIADMFDVVTYGKGASILRMFSSILGEEEFKRWINTYLNRTILSGRVAKPDDLFAALANSSLAEKFRPWTEVAGHPIVNVSSMTYNGRPSLRLSQVKEDLTGSGLPTGLLVPIKVYSKDSEASVSFMPLQNEASANYEYNYTVQPLYSTGQMDYWLGHETVDLRLNGSLPEWFLINVNSTGFYRVLYDEKNWKSLRNAITRVELPSVVRAQLVSDALSLMMTGYLQPRVAFDFVEFLKSEEDLLVWKAALMAFKEIRDHLLGWIDPRDELDRFVRGLMNKALTINFDENEDPHYEKVLQMYLAKQACTYHTQICTRIQALPRDNQTLIERVDRDTDGAVLCELARTDSEFWEKLFSMYLNSSIPTQKARYLTSLSCTVNSTLQSKLLSYSLQPDIIKLQDFKSTFTRICNVENGTTSAINFIRDKGAQFVSYASSKRTVNQMLQAISNKLYTNGMIKEMGDLLSSTPALGLSDREKSELISKAKRTAGKRQLVARRVCEGFQLACVPPQDPVPPADDNAASGVVLSLTALLASILISFKMALQ